MDLNHILEMKQRVLEELGKLDALRDSMQTTLNGLEKWEQTLTGGGTLTGVVSSATQDSMRRITVRPINTEGPLPFERVHRALETMHGQFYRSDLAKKANSDGMGEIARGTFANIFSKLLSRNQIVCINGESGKRDSLYMKSSEATEIHHPPKQQPIFGDDEGGNA